jgi:DnaK suppressor protein
MRATGRVAEPVVSRGEALLIELMRERFRARLEAEREAASARLERKLYEARSVDDGSVGDEMDRAIGVSEATRLFAGARRERALIREIERALGKLERGDYGVCEGTGERIDERRLEAQPWTRYSRVYLELLEEERAA